MNIYLKQFKKMEDIPMNNIKPKERSERVSSTIYLLIQLFLIIIKYNRLQTEIVIT
jgi:hypothetical protein